MPLPSTLTPIATQTLTAAAGTITFSSIPQTYTDLVVIANGRMTAAGQDQAFFCRLNGDGATNYSWTQLAGNGTSAYSDRLTNDSYCRLGKITGSSAASGHFANNVINFQNYFNTTTNKTILTRGNASNAELNAAVSLWRSTAAITSITFYCAGLNNWEIGSSFTIYGVKAA
jgi:hypothetical protein